MVIDTLYGNNPCGPLGPTATSAIFAFDLTDVSTLVPYMDATATTRRSTRQLYLSDLGVDCSTSFDESSLRSQTHPTKDVANRCNPSLVIPIEIKRYGYPYWKHCGNHGNKFGLFDPPYAISTVDGGLLGPSSPAPVSTPFPTTPAPTSAPAGPATTANTSPEAPGTTTIPEAPGTTVLVVPGTTGPEAPGTTGSETPGTTHPVAPGTTVPEAQGTTSPGAQVDPTQTPVVVSFPQEADPTTAAGAPSLAVVPSANELFLQHSNPSTVLPSPAGAASSNSIYYPPPPPEDSYTKDYETSTVPAQVASLGPDGLVVINEGGSTTSTYVVPAMGTPGYGSGSGSGSGIASQHATVAVYQGQTLTVGGAAITVTSATVVAPAGTSSSAESSSSSSSISLVATAGASRLAGSIAGGIGALAVLACAVLFLAQ